MQVIQGKDLMIAVVRNGQPVPICNITDFVLRRQRDVKEISGPQGLDRDYIPSYKGYTISVSGVVTYVDGYTYLDLERAFESGEKLQWRGSDHAEGGVVHGGTILLTNLDWASPVRGDFSFEVAAIGCGPKTTELLPILTDVYLADENKVRLAGCPNPYPVALYWYSEDGNAPADVIGIALNNDDVINLFNNYPNNIYFEISAGDSGCDFNMLVDWDAPFTPTVIFANPEDSLALWSGRDDEAISNDQDNDNAISPGYA